MPSLQHRVVWSAALAVAAACARAQDGDDDGQRVHRCVGLRGEVVFSGFRCDSNEQAGVSAGALDDDTLPPPAADACPASPQDLRDRVAVAVARHDANAIAGMLRWRGVGASEADQRLRELRELVREPLLSLEQGEGLLVRTGSQAGGGVRERAFGIDAEAGCWWLDW
ncbi:MAG TPA: hypothetical protein VFS55_09695 [Dokdonella sp.]|nr:hypothetical protein [Dokdonella sp.]